MRTMRSPIAQLAQSMIGVQYRYGGAHPSEGFDCSGLVFFRDQEKLSHVGIYLVAVGRLLPWR